MFINQYEDFLRGIGCDVDGNHHQHGFPTYRYRKDGLNIPVLIAEGKHAGKVLPVRKVEGAKLKVEDETGKPVALYYHQVERLDALGQPMIEPIRDMTGRTIAMNDWVAYMAHNPRTNGSGLGIAKVVDSNRKGELTVKIAMFDGEKVNHLSALGGGMQDFGEDGLRPLSNPRRALRLPIEGQDLMMLFMSDFARFADDA